jgi:hypothetical protein
MECAVDDGLWRQTMLLSCSPPGRVGRDLVNTARSRFKAGSLLDAHLPLKGNEPRAEFSGRPQREDDVDWRPLLSV